MNYKLKIMYDGSFFHGYAKQNDGIKTIQNELEEKLKLIFNSKISVHASGRTDKYVHALDQTINFKTTKKIDEKVIKNFLNSKLEHIWIKSVEIVDDHFHSRFSIKSKIYAYIVNLGEFNIFKERYEYQYNKIINVKKIEEIKNLFIGKKDFRSFSTSDMENTTREIETIEIFMNKNKLIFLIKGKGFLRNMVRMIVATLISFSEGKISKEDIINLFLTPKKGSSINKAPACGLYLFKTIY